MSMYRILKERGLLYGENDDIHDNDTIRMKTDQQIAEEKKEEQKQQEDKEKRDYENVDEIVETDREMKKEKLNVPKDVEVIDLSKKKTNKPVTKKKVAKKRVAKKIPKEELAYDSDDSLGIPIEE